MKTQYLLNKLISEEVLAFETYKCIMLIIKGMISSNLYNKSFLKSIIDTIDILAEDEWHDHAVKLIDYAVSRDLEFPVCHNDYKRFAGQTCVNMSETIEPNRDLDYYLNYIYVLEQDAIASYMKCLKDGIESNECENEFLELLEHNLEDEQEHAEKIAIAFQASQISI